MNDRFTEKARNAIEKARAAAMELGHSYIGTEHLLLGIVRETDALGSRVLRENGFEEDLVMDLIEKAAGRGAPGMPVQGLTPRCRRVIEIAVAEANRLRHSYVGTEHLLMGILREPESTAAHLLTAAGGDLNVSKMTLGGRMVLPSVRIYEQVGSNMAEVQLSALSDSTVAAKDIAACHLNTSGMVDFIVLKSITGDAYTYGRLTEGAPVSGGSIGGLESSNATVIVTNHGGSATYVCAFNYKQGGFGGVAPGGDFNGTPKAASLVELTEIKKELLPYMEKALGSHGESMLFFMLTDIINESTELLFYGGDSKNVVSEAFHKEPQEGEQSVILPGVVSRKKQLAPQIMMALQ